MKTKTIEQIRKELNLPEPVRKLQREHTSYWLIKLTNDSPIEIERHSEVMDKEWLNRGLIYRTKEEALQASKAIIKLLEGEV